MSDAASRVGKKFSIAVPSAAVPGQTVLGIQVGSESLDVLVPNGAKVGDKLVLSENLDTGSWSVQLVRANVVASPSADSFSSQPVFEKVVAAIQRCGGVVSSKFERKYANDSGMCGMFAREKIEEGEELLRVPSNCFISDKTVKAAEPDLFEIFENLSGLEREGLLGEARLATFLARLLADALTRRENDVHSKPASGPKNVWEAHAEALLEEDFSTHPYSKMVHHHDETCASLFPSPEGVHIEARAKEAMQTCRLIMQKLPPVLLGPRFGPGFYLNARLCVLTRSCDCTGEVAVVPIFDFFNHSQDYGLSWRFSAEEDSCIVRARRDHAAGDQLFISYGQKSNPLLYRTYGFTVPAESEPAWVFVLQGPKPTDIYEEYLPEDFAEHAIHFDTATVNDSLLEALSAVKNKNMNSSDFLYKLCTRCREAYEQDSVLGVYIAALQRVRTDRSDSSAWWSEVSLDSKLEDVIRVKMSEYLALTAHIEIAEVSAGRRMESQCLKLRGESLVRHALVRACTS